MMQQKHRAVFLKQWAVFLGIASIEAALLYKLISGQAAPHPTELIIAICTVAILLLISLNVDALKSISLTKEGVKADLAVLQDRTSENEQAITDLILLSMGKDAYFNLQKLARGAFGPFEKPPHMGLETELYHLRNLGYVVLNEKVVPNKKKVPSIHEIPESGDELSDYIEVTDEGKKYLALREEARLRTTAY